MVETAASSAEADSNDSRLSAALSEFLQHYAPAPIPPTRDLVEGRYKLDLQTPLPEFDTKTARAFAASDLTDTSRKLFALVCRTGTLQRHAALALLKNVEHPNRIMLCGSGIATLSQPEEERFVLVYTRPTGKKLSELIANLKTPLNDAFINKNILTPLISTIGQLSELGISHGGIRPDNIWYNDTPVLGDCLSEPCGYAQPFYFEPIDRMQALPYAKGEGSIAQDYYALAALTICLLYGEAHLSAYTIETLSRRILRDGAYAALMRGKEPPENFNDLLRGLLSGNVNERWDYRNLKQWIEGKRSNIMLPTAPTESQRPFEFMGTQATSKRELAHLFFLHWKETEELMRGEQLMQWVLMSLRNKELSETLKRIRRNITDAKAGNDIQVLEQIMRMLLIFDPAGPIRISALAFHLDGMDALCVELIQNKSVDNLRLLSKFIEHSMSSYWMDMQSAGPDYVMPGPINAVSLKIDRLRLFIRNVGYGFGFERMLYELCPEMPCLSPLFAGKFVHTLPALLKELDRLAPKLANQQDPIDLHIAAFIANRMGILHEVKLHELIPHPSLATDQGMLALRLISMAQDRCGNIQLPGLTHWLALRVMPALGIVRSKTLRARIKAMMAERAKNGYAQSLAELVVHSNYAIADVSGFGRAVETYHHNIERIAYYKKEDVIEMQSTRTGFSIATFFAYAIFALALIKTWGMK